MRLQTFMWKRRHPSKFFLSTWPSATIGAALCLLLAFQICPAQPSKSVIDSYLQSVNHIKSYDVVFQVNAVVDGRLAATETDRDAFAIGIGRRVERFLGDETNHSIGVTDWKSAETAAQATHQGVLRGSPTTLAAVLKPGGPISYHQTFNPVAALNAKRSAQVYLADLLRDPKTRTEPLNNSDLPDGITEFRINAPGLDGPIDAFLDSKHGGLPQKIEWQLRRRGGKTAVASRMEVELFAQVDGDLWVPLKATLSLVDVNSGEVYLRHSIVVSLAKSSWNSIRSDELFLASSLPSAQHVERNWTYYYPPTRLENVKATAVFHEKAVAHYKAYSLGPPFVRWIVIALVLIPLLVFGGIALRGRFRRAGD